MKKFSEDQFIMLSALQHYAFCPRQCALIHNDQQWNENYLTAKGDLFHNRVDTYPKEKRKDVVTEFSMPIHSFAMGLSGKADIVEFYYVKRSIDRIVPIEYKSGSPKKDSTDEVQLCAQAMCLEEMTNIDIPFGFFYYGKERKRLKVEFSDQLRGSTAELSDMIHKMLDSENLPTPTIGSHCRACSLSDLCQPQLNRKKLTVNKYISNYLDIQVNSEMDE